MEIDYLRSDTKEDGKILYLKKDFIVNVTFKDTKKVYTFEYGNLSKIKEVTKDVPNVPK